jgi:hypothetical protein
MVFVILVHTEDMSNTMVLMNANQPPTPPDGVEVEIYPVSLTMYPHKKIDATTHPKNDYPPGFWDRRTQK